MAAIEHRPEHGHRQHLARADAQDLAEEQREDLGLVLSALAQERSAKSEHHDQNQGGDDVGPATPAQRADAEGSEQ